jgi:hypothetical protein
VIAVRVTFGYGAGYLLPGLRLAAAVRPDGVFRGSQCLPGGTSEIGGDDVGGMPVETAAGAVVTHGGPGIGVRGGFLHVTERHADVETGRR